MLKIASLAEAEAAKTDLEKIVRAWCDWRSAGTAATAPRAKSRPRRKKKRA